MEFITPIFTSAARVSAGNVITKASNMPITLDTMKAPPPR
jgi:hypothetical protein